jgi:hypothetical protein
VREAAPGWLSGPALNRGPLIPSFSTMSWTYWIAASPPGDIDTIVVTAQRKVAVEVELLQAAAACETVRATRLKSR